LIRKVYYDFGDNTLALLMFLYNIMILSNPLKSLSLSYLGEQIQ